LEYKIYIPENIFQIIVLEIVFHNLVFLKRVFLELFRIDGVKVTYDGVEEVFALSMINLG